MNPNILFVLLTIGAPQPELVNEETWTAEFSSRETCQTAGKEVAEHFQFKDPAPAKQNWSQRVDWICVEK